MKTVNPTIGLAGRLVTLCVACVLGMASGVMSGPAWAGETIDNTASVRFSFRGEEADSAQTLQSNTVRIKVLPTPTPAAKAVSWSGRSTR